MMVLHNHALGTARDTTAPEVAERLRAMELRCASEENAEHATAMYVSMHVLCVACTGEPTAGLEFLVHAGGLNILGRSLARLAMSWAAGETHSDVVHGSDSMAAPLVAAANILFECARTSVDLDLRVVMSLVDDAQCSAALELLELVVSCRAAWGEFAREGGRQLLIRLVGRLGAVADFNESTTRFICSFVHALYTKLSLDDADAYQDAELATALLQALRLGAPEAQTISSCCGAVSNICDFMLASGRRGDARVLALLARTATAHLAQPAAADSRLVSELLRCAAAAHPGDHAAWPHSMGLCRGALAAARALPIDVRVQEQAMLLLQRLCAADPEAMEFFRRRGGASLCMRAMRIHAFDMATSCAAAAMFGQLGPSVAEAALAEASAALRASGDDVTRIMRGVRVLELLAVTFQDAWRACSMSGDFTDAVTHALNHVSGCTPAVYVAVGLLFIALLRIPRAIQTLYVVEGKMLAAVLVARLSGASGAEMPPAVMRALVRVASAADYDLVEIAADIDVLDRHCRAEGVEPMSDETDEMRELISHSLECVRSFATGRARVAASIKAWTQRRGPEAGSRIALLETMAEEHRIFDAAVACAVDVRPGDTLSQHALNIRRAMYAFDTVTALRDAHPGVALAPPNAAAQSSARSAGRSFMSASMGFVLHMAIQKRMQTVGDTANARLKDTAGAEFQRYATAQLAETQRSPPCSARAAWLKAEMQFAASVIGFADAARALFRASAKLEDGTPGCMESVAAAYKAARESEVAALAADDAAAEACHAAARTVADAACPTENDRRARVRREAAERAVAAAAAAAATRAAREAAAATAAERREEVARARAERAAAEAAARERDRALAEEEARLLEEGARLAAAEEAARAAARARAEDDRRERRRNKHRREVERARAGRLAASPTSGATHTAIAAPADRPTRPRREVVTVSVAAPGPRAAQSPPFFAPAASRPASATSFAAAAAGSSASPAAPALSDAAWPAPSSGRRKPEAPTAGDSSGPKCSVCYDRPNTHLFVPCAHMCVCGVCAAELMRSTARCPLCRQASTGVLAPIVAGYIESPSLAP